MKMQEQHVSWFEDRFYRLTDHNPFPWQIDLYCRLYANDLPERCSLPTGTGKTSIITIWLLALVRQSIEGILGLPRRLVYVVNRRTVVDQATSDVERLARRLEARSGLRYELKDVADALESLRAFPGGEKDSPLYVSTLRGQLADNGLWKRDPAAPAIIVGTVDMLGSRLLFSGYGDSKYSRPLHAGLLGTDTLIVHDEAHLTPAFGYLLRQIAELQNQFTEGVRGVKPIKVTELSATLSGNQEGAFHLSSDDYENSVLINRLRPPGGKQLRLYESPKDNIEQKIVELATHHEKDNVPVVIYVSTVSRAKKVRTELEKTLGKHALTARVRLLTGTIRGYERDSLVEDPIFRRFLLSSDGSMPSPNETSYLIATSAGEVGVDLNAAHGVCDLTNLMSMAQRFGRINRSGNWIGTVIDVVHPPEDSKDIEEVDKDCLKVLRDLPGLESNALDASPEVLKSLKFTDRDAFGFLPLTKNVLDAWSLTSLRHDETGAPSLESYLHGLTDREPPHCWVAWRADLDWLLEAGDESLADALRVYPLRSREVLQDLPWRVRDDLKKIVKRHSKASAVLVGADGDARRIKLADLLKSGPPAYSTLILPASLGGLSQGLMDGAFQGAIEDVSTEPMTRVVVHISKHGDFWGVEKEMLPAWAFAMLASWKSEGDIYDAAKSLAKKAGLSCALIVPIGKGTRTEQAGVTVEEPEQAVVYLISTIARDNSDNLQGASRQDLDEHLARTEKNAHALAQKLGLEPAISSAVTFAARGHDRGKNRQAWQKAIGNITGPPLAKSEHPGFNSSFTQGYRHEFGSLLDVINDKSLQELQETDLTMHLIAAHHGHARPGFEERAMDRTKPFNDNAKMARESSMRFVKLQSRFGWWVLAWLETLIKSADGRASE